MSSTELELVKTLKETAPTRPSRRSSLALGASLKPRTIATALKAGAVAASEGATITAQGSHPAVRRIDIKDLKEVLAMGFDDFTAMPTHVVFLSIIYPIVAFMLARITFHLNVVPLLFPIIAGFSLIGPFAAIGLYELSRRREQTSEAFWWHAFEVLRSPSIRAIAILGTVLTVMFFIWLVAALAVYQLTIDGAAPVSVAEFARAVFTTSAGWALIIVGNGVGLIFATGVFAISVISFPLLLDRDVSAATAVRTSLTAVLRNPKVMAIWGLIVTGALVIGTLPLFVGLAVVMPVLAHSSWHLYRRVVTP